MKIKKFIIYILVFVFVFFSSPLEVYADEVDYDDYFLTLIQNIQSNEGIYGGATNYLLMDYDNYYILLISQSSFGTHTFTYEGDTYMGIDFTGITGGGWFLISSNAELTDDPDDWSQMKFNNNNYSLDYYNTNILTFVNTSGQPLIVNTAVDKDGHYINDIPVEYLYCTQEIEGFTVKGSNFNPPEPDPDEEYRDGVLGVLDRIIDGIVNLPNLIVEGIKDFLTGLFIPEEEYLNTKKIQIENSFSNLLGFNVSTVEALFDSANTGEDLLVGETSKIKINGIGEIEFKTFDNGFLLTGINKFKPIIRGFIALMLVFFNLNQLLNLIGQSSLTGMSNNFLGSGEKGGKS